ncbi:MAG TPA: efflux transporter outer membrane subunit [Steroidobacteraceae bacterium]|jgi:multidrug efflux system outer membrane protein
MVRVLALLAAALLTACAVGPDYRAPAVADVAAHNLDGAHFSGQAPSSDWWQAFPDPLLTQLEQRALAANLDIAQALEHVHAARAAFTESKLDYAPHVPLELEYQRSKEQFPGFSSDRIDIAGYTAGFDASWELDLFGHVRRSAEAAGARLGAQQATLADTQVRVAAEVARNYFELRGAQRQLAVAHDNIANEQEALRLTQVRYDAGRVTELDVDSALSRLKATEATVPLLEAAEKRADYRLAVLLCQKPGDLDDELTAASSSPVWTDPLPLGDVSALLRHRPDVRIAERNLAAASAQVGVATADLFPRVTVTGFVGFLTGDGAQLGAGSSRAWAVSPVLNWPALDFASARARLRATRAESAAVFDLYQQTVLGALEDFENATVNYGRQIARLSSVVEQADASRRAARMAEIQYREGQINFLVLLDAQRTELEAEDQVAQAETAVNTGAVAVYKALGGVPATADEPKIAAVDR